jgi:hypothetical protein
MGPHSDDFDRFDIVQNLAHHTVLDIDPSGTSTREISQEFLVNRRGLVRVFSQKVEQSLRLRLQTGSG